MGAAGESGDEVVVRLLADGERGRTELVSRAGTLLVRKEIPLAFANPDAWRALQAISDPSLPRVVAIEQGERGMVVTCDYVDGWSVADRVREAGRLEVPEAAGIARGVCHAAGVLHEHGIIHRDISPSNVIVSADGVHLIDLGIARKHVEGARRDTTHFGTRGFIAPEQFGFAQTDARSDVYSIGRLLGYMLTGAWPDQDAYADALEDVGVVPASARAVVDKACAIDPVNRYRSAAELRDAIGALVEVTVVAASLAASPTPAASAAPAAPAGPAPEKAVRPIGRLREYLFGTPGPAEASLSGTRRALSYVILAFMAVATPMLLYGSFGTAAENVPGWNVIIALVCWAILVLAYVLPLAEAYRAVLRRRDYANEDHVGRRLFLAWVKWYLVLAAIVTALMLLGTFLFGRQATR